MNIKGEVVRTAQELAKRIGAGLIIIISPDAQAIKKEIELDIPVIIARVMGGRRNGDDVFVDVLSKLPKNITKGSLFLKVSRIELMSEAVEAAYIKGRISNGVVLGIVSVGDINSIVVMDITDIPLIKKITELASTVDYTVLKAVLNLAIDIGREGREGKKIGTAFIIDDTEKVMGMSHQIVLNPYEGHKKKDRDIKDENNWETVKEFAQLDGMFIVDEEGYIVAAGRYLDVSARGVELQPGLGGRHLAAAAISKSTKAIAITVSETSGVVSVYKDGKEAFTIDPRISIT
ncbi:DNA integrity scanning protein DisA nucleotide-binding domain protein [Methanocella conradii]|uniref:DNA integrity scanning protein DisA nucleotide-binding domain protein n=1 Tax=Methanocella conradii TaxID=1175444 RepID=UPI0024B39121|nr:diadenylate cyclase [Methanocella conradii]MDI6897862.1 diadenylate cyclase [Methanocella conradii]